MDAPTANKPLFIFAALLFTTIVSGTIFTGRELSRTKAQSQPSSSAPTAMPTPLITPDPTPDATLTPTLLVTDPPPVLPAQKPSVNVRREDDDD